MAKEDSSKEEEEERKQSVQSLESGNTECWKYDWKKLRNCGNDGKEKYQHTVCARDKVERSQGQRDWK